jgi:hemerythrin-like domain-containing protein
MSTDMQAMALPPYAVLEREHRLIERALGVLGRLCDDIHRTKELDASAASEVIRFLRDFADGAHHLKEERILFPAIEAKTFFPGCGLVSEHERGRDRVRSMAAAVERWSRGDREAAMSFFRYARSYINLLREHIAKEDSCLADVVAGAFSGDDRERLVREFAEMERREIGDRVFERFAGIVEALEARFGAESADGSGANRIPGRIEP